MNADVREEVKPDSEVAPEERAKQLPTPAGYKILCAVPQLDIGEKFDGSSLYRPAVDTYQEAQATVVLFVVKMGPDAYADKERYPSGPWCKVGDFVIVRQYSGTFVRIRGKDFRFLNEDQIEGTIEDPRGVVRAQLT